MQLKNKQITPLICFEKMREYNFIMITDRI